MIGLIALLSAFVPLSTDLYLPALPGMARYFGVSVDLTNLTLILFFLFFSAGTLVWGPLSDKYGRRPVLIAGLVIYVAASIWCANAGDIFQLIGARVLQASGGSAAVSVATAMVKDVYASRHRESILAIVQSMVLISPMAAPVLGAFLLSFTSWRGVFWTLAGIGVLALAGSFALVETIDRRSDRSAFQVVCRLGAVLRNTGFSSLMFIFSLVSVSTLAFVASSSYIYINGFGLSEQVYSYYFAVNALGLILGPMIYLRISRRMDRRSIIMAGFAAIAASGALVCLFGSLRPWMLAAFLLPATISSSCVRTPGTNLMLEQQREDTGSAASLMSFFAIFMGSIGMTIISIDWGDVSTVFVLGAMNLIIGLVCEGSWLLVSQREFVTKVPDRASAATKT